MNMACYKVIYNLKYRDLAPYTPLLKKSRRRSLSFCILIVVSIKNRKRKKYIYHGDLAGLYEKIENRNSSCSQTFGPLSPIEYQQ